MKIVFIDDDIDRFNLFAKNNSGHDIIHFDHPLNAIEYLKANDIPSVLCLDHDLGVELTVMPVVKWILENIQLTTFMKVVVHSMNPVGSANIIHDLRHSACDVFKIPGCWTMKDVVNQVLTADSQ